MQVYKYMVRVTKKGQIKVDLNPDLYNKDVELTIVAKSENKSVSQTAAMDLVECWSGFLQKPDIDADKLKYEYLKNKYK